MRSLLVAVVLLLTVSSGAGASLFGLFGDGAESVTAPDGVVRIHVAGFPHKSARHYLYRADGAEIRFFVVRDSRGDIRTALDACEVCWQENKGYVLKKDAMVCRNCGRFFPLEKIGVLVNGCNPHPVTFQLVGDSVLVGAEELRRGARFFPAVGT